MQKMYAFSELGGPNQSCSENQGKMHCIVFSIRISPEPRIESNASRSWKCTLSLRLPFNYELNNYKIEIVKYAKKPEHDKNMHGWDVDTSV